MAEISKVLPIEISSLLEAQQHFRFWIEMQYCHLEGYWLNSWDEVIEVDISRTATGFTQKCEAWFGDNR